MTVADDDTAGRHPLAAVICRVGCAVDAGLGASTVGMTQPQARGLLVALEVQERRLHALRLRLVAESVAHDRVLAAVPGGGDMPGQQVEPGEQGQSDRRGVRTQTAAWMRSALRVSAGRAHGEVRAAALLDPDRGDLRELGTALAAGTTSAEHVRVGCRAMTRIPKHFAVAHRETLSVALTEHATGWAPETADRLAGHLLGVLDPEATDRYDPAALDRRSLHMGTDSTGMLITRGEHDPTAGAFLKAAIDALAGYDRHLPHPTAVDDGETLATIGVNDLRPSPQRRVDALDTLVRAGVAHLAGCTTTGIGAAMTRLIITATIDQVAAVTGTEDTGTEDTGTEDTGALDTRTPGSATCVGHGPITAGFLQLAACDAVIDRVILDTNGAIVSMTSTGRYATPAIVRALIARDGGCAFPGCPAPPGTCDAHHVTWWSRGGPTHTDNLVLLCGHHHRLIHTGEWDVTNRDGIPWFRPPHHHDPQRRWLRNTLTDATHRARALAQHLAADHRTGPGDRWWLRDARAEEAADSPDGAAG